MGPDKDPASLVPYQNEQLQEETFSWETREDFSGSLTQVDAGSLRVALFDAFAPHLPPPERSVRKLKAAIDVLRNGSRGTSGWGDALSTGPYEGEQVNVRANPALSLLHHLRWVFDVFHNVPDASVTVR